jgi:hypothetical protein
METGDLTQWEMGGGEFNSGDGNSYASTDQAHTGHWSAKMVINPGGGTRLFRWNETRAHDQAYYSAWYYFPTQYDIADSGWWNIFQWKSSVGSANDAFWTVGPWKRTNGDLYLTLYDWQNRVLRHQTVADIPVGEWFHLECLYVKGSNWDGQVQCWQDGNELWNLTGINTLYPNGDLGWSINNYGEGISPTPIIIYTDDATISPTPTHPTN